MPKNYSFGLEAWGLALFLPIMLPNFVWFALPAPNDVLRAESITPIIDAIASIAQVMSIVELCIIVRKDSEKPVFNALSAAAGVFCALYYAAWIAYYLGVANSAVIIGLCIFPCASFICFALYRKNYIALVPLTVFTVCHMIYGTVNFII